MEAFHRIILFRWLIFSRAVTSRMCFSAHRDAKYGDKAFNSLQRVRRKKDDEVTNRIGTRICLSVVGNGAVGQPRCLCLSTEFKSYLFNCGEGMMRLAREHTVDTLYVKHVFITDKSWQNLSGMSDVYLSLQESNVKRFTLHGPPGVEDFIGIVSSQQKKVTVSKRNVVDSPFIDSTVEIDYVPVRKRQSYYSNYHARHSSSFQKSGLHTDFVVSYVCKIRPRPGDFSPKKCAEIGVPLGPPLHDLKNGKDIVLPSGKVVKSSDVHEKNDPGCIFLVVECPNVNMIDCFIGEPKLCPRELSKLEKEFGDVCAVFHFSPSNVMQSYKYVQWMNKFPDSCLHFALNASNSTLSSEAIHRLQHTLHHLHPAVFPLLHEQQCQYAQDLHDSKKNVIQADAMLKFHLRPERMLDRANVVNVDSEKLLQNVYDIPMFSEHVKQFHSTLSKNQHVVNCSHSLGNYPEVIFLGTASSMSTAFRNVTAILVNPSQDDTILLDCGEGTYAQLLRYFGPNNVNTALRKISCIFISHHHTDHFLGLFTLVKARKRAFLLAGDPYVPVAVMTTRPVELFIKNFHRMFEPLKEDIKQFPNSVCSDEGKFAFKDDLAVHLEGVTLLPVPVTHCKDSHGLVISGNGWKIVYSGDAAPSQTLIDAGKDCTLLIHEASIEDGLANEAAVKMHSTPSQVVEMANKMNAEYAILTHFSRRYLEVPLFPESQKIGCAFDFMRVTLRDLPTLPLLIPALKCLFSEQQESFIERTSAVVNFEKVFFKTYKR